MKTKSCRATFKQYAADDDAPQFQAIVSVFNNPDHDRDIVRPGAFADTIAGWKSSGDTLPVLWSHRTDDPMANIGGVTDIEELAPGDERIPEWAHPWVKANGGLWVKALLDSGADASPLARQVAHLLRKRRVTQFSYAYDVDEQRPTKDGGFNELLKLRLLEVSPTFAAANELTELGVVKTAGRPDPPQEPPAPIPTPEPRPSPGLLRLRCDLAAMQHEHTD